MVSRDVIEEVLEDHKEIKALFARVESASGGQRLDAFNNLVRKLATHETAEQEIVHPLTLQANGKGVRDERVSEEKEAEIVLDELLKMGPDDRMFTSKFEALRRDVLAHADREEAEEHPKIRATIAADRLRALAPAFRAAEATAPTRPHPRGPVSATGNMIVGPIVSIMDRARDAIRNAMSSIGDRAKSSGGAVSTPPSRPRATSTRSGSGSARAKGPVIHVTTDPRGGWRAAKQGGSRALARSDSKREVVKRARDAAKSQEGRLVVHGQDGRIQEERSYGADPIPSRG